MSGRCVGYRFCLRDRIGTLYCYYQYLQYRLEPDEEKKDAVVRLFRKKLEDVNGRFYLQLLQLKMLPEMYEEEEASRRALRCSIRMAAAARSSILRRCVSSGRIRNS